MDFLDNPDETIVNENGGTETWLGNVNRDQILKDFNEHVSKLKGLYE